VYAISNENCTKYGNERIFKTADLKSENLKNVLTYQLISFPTSFFPYEVIKPMPKYKSTLSTLPILLHIKKSTNYKLGPLSYN
jgi:hypothetical protein